MNIFIISKEIKLDYFCICLSGVESMATANRVIKFNNQSTFFVNTISLTSVYRAIVDSICCVRASFAKCLYKNPNTSDSNSVFNICNLSITWMDALYMSIRLQGNVVVVSVTHCGLLYGVLFRNTERGMRSAPLTQLKANREATRVKH